MNGTLWTVWWTLGIDSPNRRHYLPTPPIVPLSLTVPCSTRQCSETCLPLYLPPEMLQQFCRAKKCLLVKSFGREYKILSRDPCSSFRSYVISIQVDKSDKGWWLCLTYRRHVLEITDGINNPGTIRWQLLIALMLAWIFVFLCLFKGVNVLGKVREGQYGTFIRPHIGTYIIHLFMMLWTAILIGIFHDTH